MQNQFLDILTKSTRNQTKYRRKTTRRFHIIVIKAIKDGIQVCFPINDSFSKQRNRWKVPFGET